MSTAQFVALTETDRTFTLPGPAATNDRELASFDLLGVDTTRTALLMFKVRYLGPARLMMMLNSSELDIDYLYQGAGAEVSPRTWHEIVPGSHLLPTGNRLTVALTQEPGPVEVSDIVILYHATN